MDPDRRIYLAKLFYYLLNSFEFLFEFQNTTHTEEKLGAKIEALWLFFCRTKFLIACVI